MNRIVQTLAIGTTCNKYGQKSKYATILTTGTENITYTLDDDSKTQITIKGLVCADLKSGTSQKGDSGGPIYISQNGKWTFCGVHSGADTSASSVYFTPYLHIYGVFTAKTS